VPVLQQTARSGWKRETCAHGQRGEAESARGHLKQQLLRDTLPSRPTKRPKRLEIASMRTTWRSSKGLSYISTFFLTLFK